MMEQTFEPWHLDELAPEDGFSLRTPEEDIPSGSDFQDADALGSAFPTAMVAAALLSASGGVVALLTIRQDALDEAPVARAPGAVPQAQGSSAQ